MSVTVTAVVNVEVNEHVAITRGSGHSTAIALAILAKAVANPGLRVAIRDHFEGDDADACLADTVKSMREALELFNVAIHEEQPAPGYRGKRRRFHVIAAPVGATTQQWVRR